MTPSKEDQMDRKIIAAVKQLKDLVEQMETLNGKVDTEQSGQIEELEKRVKALEKANAHKQPDKG